MNAIRLHEVSKHYRLYRSPWDRVIEVITGHSRHQEVHALHDINLDIPRGEVVGVVGRNGAGKSTLLKLVTQTLVPSLGTVEVQGRVSALLELGGGFHPQMTGRDNVFLNMAVAGLDREESQRLFPEIVAFSGIGEFIDRPVKSYSSGMFTRLAFSVATAVEPEVLIVDEALSVGDGAFARQSFDRIMGFRERDKTILFCSHSLYQVEAICDRVVWLDGGRVMMDGPPKLVIAEYGRSLSGSRATSDEPNETVSPSSTPPFGGGGRFVSVIAMADGVEGRVLSLRSGETDLTFEMAYEVDSEWPDPTLGLTFYSREDGGRIVSSAISDNDGATLRRDDNGKGIVRVTFPHCPLLKGRYTVDVYLACEGGIHFYDWVQAAVTLEVTQPGLEAGYVSMVPRNWETLTK